MNKPVVLERQERCAQLAAHSPWGGEVRGMSSSAEPPRGVYLQLGPKPLDSLGLLWIWSQSHLMTHLKDSHLNTDSDNCLTMCSKIQVRYDSRKGSILIETARASRVGGCSHWVSGHQSPVTDLMSSRGWAPCFPLPRCHRTPQWDLDCKGFTKECPGSHSARGALCRSLISESAFFPDVISLILNMKSVVEWCAPMIDPSIIPGTVSPRRSPFVLFEGACLIEQVS